MKPVLFTVFGFPIRAYGFFIAVGFLAGIWLTQRVARRRRPDHVRLIDDFAAIALLSAIAGARLWEVAFTWGYYGNHLSEILAIWHGGLSIQGAVAGGAIAALWFCRARKVSFWDLADTLTPGLLLGQAIGRLGACFLNGDAYGRPTGTRFGLVYPPGSQAYMAYGAVPLWPAEVFEGVWDLLVMVFALWLLRRERGEGTTFLWYALLYSLGRFSLEFLRGDSLMFMGLKAAQVSSLLFAFAAAGLLIARHYKGGVSQCRASG